MKADSHDTGALAGEVCMGSKEGLFADAEMNNSGCGSAIETRNHQPDTAFALAIVQLALVNARKVLERSFHFLQRGFCHRDRAGYGDIHPRNDGERANYPVHGSEIQQAFQEHLPGVWILFTDPIDQQCFGEVTLGLLLVCLRFVWTQVYAIVAMIFGATMFGAYLKHIQRHALGSLRPLLLLFLCSQVTSSAPLPRWQGRNVAWRPKSSRDPPGHSAKIYADFAKKAPEALTKKRLSLVRHFCEEQRISQNKAFPPHTKDVCAA